MFALKISIAGVLVHFGSVPGRDRGVPGVGLKSPGFGKIKVGKYVLIYTSGYFFQGIPPMEAKT